MNHVTILGRLGADPEVRSFSNGGKVCNLRVATSETWKDKSTGEKKERTEWHTVAIFNEGLAGVAERFLRKGSRVLITGSLQTRKWSDQSGQDRYSTEIILRPFNGELEIIDWPDKGGEPSGNYTPPSPRGGLDDEIPF